jgi:hypothetical protein
MSQDIERMVARVEKFVDIYDERAYSARDLLADLMHWCSKNDLDFDQELDSARNSYKGEIEDAKHGNN